jgi:radical SAM protein with 4Fe4S-binding SPASM domain
MIFRLFVPSRIALIYRDGETLGYNPAINVWYRLDEDTAEVIRWLRAGRDRNSLQDHLVRRFNYTLVVAQKRLQEILKWCVVRKMLYLDKEPDFPPIIHPSNPLVTVYWICTQACNLRCTYCYQSAEVARPNELSTVEGKNLVDQAVEAGVKTFVFTGGEAFLRRDLLEVARYSSEQGLRTNVITNGQLINRKNIQEVGEIFNKVTISLDHAIPEHHDRNRGQGSWMRAVNAIELLVEAGVPVDINSVLSRFGLKDLGELLSFVNQKRVDQHRITPQFPMGRGACSRSGELTSSEILNLSDQIYHAKRDLVGGNESETKHKIDGNYNNKGIRRNHCGAELSEVSVDPEGWVYPCKLLQYPQFRTGNIREQPLVDIVNNHPSLQSTRSRVADTLAPCKSCIIKNHCGGGCRGIHFSLTNEYIKSNPLFCAYLRRSFEGQAWASTGDVPSPRRNEFNEASEEILNA